MKRTNDVQLTSKNVDAFLEKSSEDFIPVIEASKEELATRTFVRAVRKSGNEKPDIKPVDFFGTQVKSSVPSEKSSENTKETEKETEKEVKKDDATTEATTSTTPSKLPFGSTSSSIFGAGSGSLISFGSVKPLEAGDSIFGKSESSSNTKALEGLTAEADETTTNYLAPGNSLVPVEIDAGDEADVTLFKVYTKCFLLDDGEKGKEYKQRGSGDLCVNTLTVDDTKKARLLMRVDKTQHLVVNSLIFPQMARDIVSEKHVRVSVLDTESPTSTSTTDADKEKEKEKETEKDEDKKDNKDEKKDGKAIPRVITYLFRCKNASEATQLLAAINTAIASLK